MHIHSLITKGQCTTSWNFTFHYKSDEVKKCKENSLISRHVSFWWSSKNVTEVVRFHAVRNIIKCVEAEIWVMLSVEHLMLNKRRKMKKWIYNAIFQCQDIVVKLSITTTIVEISAKISVHLVVINSTVRFLFDTSWFATNQAVVINSEQDWLGTSS